MQLEHSEHALVLFVYFLGFKNDTKVPKMMCWGTETKKQTNKQRKKERKK